MMLDHTIATPDISKQNQYETVRDHTCTTLGRAEQNYYGTPRNKTKQNFYDMTLDHTYTKPVHDATGLNPYLIKHYHTDTRCHNTIPKHHVTLSHTTITRPGLPCITDTSHAWTILVHYLVAQDLTILLPN